MSEKLQTIKNVLKEMGITSNQVIVKVREEAKYNAIDLSARLGIKTNFTNILNSVMGKNECVRMSGNRGYLTATFFFAK